MVRGRQGLSAVLVFLSAAFLSPAWGQATPGQFSFGGETRAPLKIRGRVLCVECSRDEVQKAQPARRHLYELRYAWEEKAVKKLVMEVDWVSEPQRWSYVNPHIWVRGTGRLLGRLMAEENLNREAEVTFIPRNSGTLDLVEVLILEGEKEPT